MPLVDYGYSDNEESDNEENEGEEKAIVESNVEEKASKENEQISKLKLPIPKVLNDINVEEEDDEFLHKKEVAPVIAKPELPKRVNGKVQISIPSLRDFQNDDKDKKHKVVPIIGAELPQRATGLLSMLPKPKGYTSAPATSTATSSNSSKPVNTLIPHSVANRSKKNVPDKKAVKKPSSSKVLRIIEDPEEDEDDEEEGQSDFFSFNSDRKLPEICMNEINAMVAKKAAQMADAFKEPEPGVVMHQYQETVQIEQNNIKDDIIHKSALQSLIGGNRAKRAKMEDINIIEINSNDIIPSKDEFERSTLMNKTGFMPTGNLTGDWSCTSKKKSHVTYLAEKAKANEQELEAIWSMNRQTRRQTQSKYGF